MAQYSGGKGDGFNHAQVNITTGFTENRSGKEVVVFGDLAVFTVSGASVEINVFELASGKNIIRKRTNKLVYPNTTGVYLFIITELHTKELIIKRKIWLDK